MKTRPRALRAALATIASAVLLTSVTACSTSADPVDLPATRDFESQLLDQINALRLEEGVDRLDDSDCMADHARERAALLPGAVEVPREDLPADCGDFDYVGENVSRSDQPANEVVTTWAEDDRQYPNLVDPQFEEAGVGCVAVSAADSTRVAEPGEEVAGMACSVIFQGYAP